MTNVASIYLMDGDSSKAVSGQYFSVNWDPFLHIQMQRKVASTVQCSVVDHLNP